MKIALITPAGTGSRNGNRNTAVRWARLLRESGYRVRLATQWDGAPADLMLALHARRSHASIRAFNDRYPERALLVALTGTDLYRDIQTDHDAIDSLQRATRLIVLQDQGPLELAPELRDKTDVVYQSARSVVAPPPLKAIFEVSLLAHLREEKDPFCAAAALAFLPAHSRLHVRHYGKALVEDMAATALEWMQQQTRYQWFGERPHHLVARRLARSRALIISSRMEGGANAASEAIAQGVPTLASHIAGNIGMFGSDYAGYYPVGDAQALARLMLKIETDDAFRDLLTRQTISRRALISRDRERDALRASITKALESSSDAV